MIPAGHQLVVLRTPLLQKKAINARVLVVRDQQLSIETMYNEWVQKNPLIDVYQTKLFHEVNEVLSPSLDSTPPTFGGFAQIMIWCSRPTAAESQVAEAEESLVAEMEAELRKTFESNLQTVLKDVEVSGPSNKDVEIVFTISYQEKVVEPVVSSS